MKKITFLLALFVLCVTGSHAQVQIGTGTDENQHTPIEPYYGYTYSQSIYLASEVNTTGSITSLKWYFSGVDALANSQQLVVYLGHTSKTEFETSADFVDASELTQVYAGGITPPSSPGWVTLTFATPFAYNGTDNLVVAVDENKPNYDQDQNNDFYNTEVIGNRSIYVYSDTYNAVPADPNAPPSGQFDSVYRDITSFVPNVIFGGIQQLCSTPLYAVSANVGITTGNFTWQPGATETAWEVLILSDGSDAPTAGTTGGIPVTGTAAYTSTTLTSGLTYQFYVRANCGSSFSAWSTPITFKTLCDPYGDFTEDFEAATLDSVPECWGKIRNANTGDAYVGVDNYGSESDPQYKLEMYNSSDANAVLIASTPILSALPLATNRLRFTAHGSDGYKLLIGTMSDRANPSTFTLIRTVDLTSDDTEYYVSFPSTTDSFIAFKHGLAGTYRTIYVDDVAWEPLPTILPACLSESDLSVAINEECGNSPTFFEWPQVEYAEGYTLSVGTAPGVYDLATVTLPSTVNNFSFTANYNSTYYYKLVPFNGAGPAVGCLEGTFTTHDTGCYCTSEPTYVEGNGITNVQLGDTDFETPPGEENQWGDVDPLTYYDHSDSPVDISQGLNTNLKINVETYYSYNINVWIDLNNNYVFEPNEIVYSGASEEYEDVSLVDGSFILPVSTSLGIHKMRITANYSDDQDPCYDGYYGVTLDFAANVVAAECTPGSVSTKVIVPDCANNQYFVDVNVVTLGSGTPVISDGTTTFPVTAAGVVHVGPYVSGTSTTLVLLHGANATCDIPVGTFSYSCPPLNDNCSGAVALTSNPTLECESIQSGTLNAATDSGIDVPEDGFGNPVNDVWYKFVATSANQRISITNVEGSDWDFSDLVHEVFSGSCEGTLVSLIQNDVNISNLTGLTIGETYYVRVYTYYDVEGADTTFDICLSTLPEAPANDNCSGAVELTSNPAMVCNAISSGTLLSATDSGIAVPEDGVGHPINDVWYKFVATSDMQKIAIGNVDYSNYEYSSLVYEVFTGTCEGTLTSIAEDFANSGDLLGLTIGQTYYVRIFTEGDLIGADTTFDICLGTIPLPPVNDDCANAISLVPGNNFDSNPLDTTIASSSSSTGVEDPTCADYEGDDIWFSVVVPESGSITIETGATSDGYTGFDSGLALYSGTCGDLTEISCDDEGASTYNFSKLSLTGRSAGEVIYIRVWEYNNTGGYEPFAISAWDSSLSTNTFDNKAFSYYPNPVKDVLNLSYTENITNVAVYNLLGQQVITNTVNSNNGKIDMSNLAGGTYMVKVTADNQIKTIKVIKE